MYKKTLRLSLVLATAAGSLLYACRREETKPETVANQIEASDLARQLSQEGFTETNPPQSWTPIVSNCTPTGNRQAFPYLITLVSKTYNGSVSTWIWSVQNPYPGNGTPNSGTAQDLSHWSIKLANNCCPTGGTPCGSLVATLSDVVSASTSTNNGASWQSFTPSLAVDPSIRRCDNISGAQNELRLKFDVGTNGTAPTLYRLVLSDDFAVDMAAQSVYKSGSRTKCGQICYPGIGCRI